MDVVVFGSAIIDFICYTQRLPKAGETLHGYKFSKGYGGKGANQCVAAARLGAKTALIAKVGDDNWGDDYVLKMKSEGINVEHLVQCKEETTGIAQICVSTGGENHIVIVAGANNKLSEIDVNNARTLFENAKVLLCQLETPINATIAALRKFHGISILNAAPALPNIPQELLQAAHILCVNENEGALISGCPEISSVEQSKVALKTLIEMGARIVIITLGSLGAVYNTRKEADKFVHVPSRKIENVIDTTGAGDAFIGALAYYTARFGNLPFYQQVGAACEVAAYSIQYPGTQSSYPTSVQLNYEIQSKQFLWHEF